MNMKNIKQPLMDFSPIYLTQAVFTGCFYGIRAIFFLYVLNRFGWNTGQVISLFAAFMTLCYGTSLIGGYMADNGLGVKNTIILGGTLNSLGFLFILFPQQDLFFLGLALAVFGSGLVKPNIATAAGLIVDNSKTSERDTVYSLLYIAMNAGNLVAPIICGFIGKSYGWHYGILLLAVFLIGAVYFVYKTMHIPNPAKGKIQLSKSMLLTAIASLITILYLLFKYQESVHGLMGIITCCSVIYLVNIFYESNAQERKNILRIIAYILLFSFFCTLYEQAGTSLMLFYEKAVDRDVMGTVIPSSAFLSLDPLFVLICGPILLFLSSKYFEKTKPIEGFVKIGYGFLCVSASFGILTFSIYQDHIPIPLTWVIGTFFIQAIGELWIAPVSFSKISQYAPPRYKSLLMSFWQMSIAYGHYFAGFIAQFSMIKGASLSANNLVEQYESFFLRLSLIALCVGLSLLLCQWIRVKIKNRKVGKKNNKALLST